MKKYIVGFFIMLAAVATPSSLAQSVEPEIKAEVYPVLGLTAIWCSTDNQEGTVFCMGIAITTSGSYKIEKSYIYKNEKTFFTHEVQGQAEVNPTTHHIILHKPDFSTCPDDLIGKNSLFAADINTEYSILKLQIPNLPASSYSIQLKSGNVTRFLGAPGDILVPIAQDGGRKGLSKLSIRHRPEVHDQTSIFGCITPDWSVFRESTILDFAAVPKNQWPASWEDPIQVNTDGTIDLPKR